MYMGAEVSQGVPTTMNWGHSICVLVAGNFMYRNRNTEYTHNNNIIMTLMHKHDNGCKTTVTVIMIHTHNYFEYIPPL